LFDAQPAAVIKLESAKRNERQLSGAQLSTRYFCQTGGFVVQGDIDPTDVGAADLSAVNIETDVANRIDAVIDTDSVAPHIPNLDALVSEIDLFNISSPVDTYATRGA
jgi:hypothetical protein